MKKSRKIEVKLKNSRIDVTGHIIGDVYFRISPSNWKPWHPMNWLTRLWGYEPVWIIIDEYVKDTLKSCWVATEYKHKLEELRTVGDLTNFIDRKIKEGLNELQREQ